ncbi:MAG: hypothetical protein J6C75_04330, partial [Oscillospiraceae bacterium]|nr:hypothetical protein [Oscillospiraceae bacterium]
MKGKFKKLLIAGVSALLVAALFAVMAQGLWDESKAVHVSPPVIEDSTLAVGTHLIHLSALTDAIYDIAIDSASESGQTQVYYKSEMADGTWFDITSATSLSEITVDGEPVTNNVAQALYFTHYTKSDGITYDLRTGQPVNIYDIRDPYDVENMEELAPLKNQFDLMDEMLGNLEEMEDEEEGESTNTAPNEDELILNIERCAVVFAKEVKSGDTDNCDRRLTALQRYSENKDGEILAEAQKIMDSIDAERRVHVLKKVDEALSVLTGELNSDENMNSMMQSATNDSIANVQASLAENESKILAPGDTVISNYYYELATQAADSPTDAVFDQLVTLERIRSDNIVDKDKELEMLDDTLIKEATNKYAKELKAGKNSEYRDAESQGLHSSLLNRIVTEAMGEVNSIRSELEFLITARATRSGNEEGMKLLDKRLETASGWTSSVRNDAFAAKLKESISSHIEFLTKLRRDMELAAGGNEMDALMKQKKELQDKMLGALDRNDLEGAKKLEGEISALDDKINGINEEKSAKANELNSKIGDLEKQLGSLDDEALKAELEKEKAKLQAELSALNSSMSDGSMGALTYDIMQQCLDIIGGDDLGSDRIATLNSNVDTLIGMLGMDYQLIFPDLKTLHEQMTLKKELENIDAFDEAILAIEKAILSNLNAYTKSLRNEMSADALSDLFDDWLKNSELANDPDGASVVFCIALQGYYDT